MKLKLPLSKKSTLSTLTFRKKRVYTMGILDLTFTLKLTENFLKSRNLEYDSIEEVEDLFFLSKSSICFFLFLNISLNSSSFIFSISDIFSKYSWMI